jgi:hypothetical protein
MTPPFVLRVGRTASGYRLRVEGEATFRGRPALFELFVLQVLDRAPGSVVVDLTGCTHLDRRFLATLFDLDRQYGSTGGGRFSVVTAREASRAPRVLGEEAVLPAFEPGGADLVRHLMGWHRILARLSDGLPAPLAPYPAEPATAQFAC